MLSVVAALIRFGNKLLVCQRRKGDRLELLWEFPGGKVESNESEQQALARELQEELAVSAIIGREIHRVRRHYAESSEPLEIAFYQAVLEGEPKNQVFEKIEWKNLSELEALDFLPADRQFVRDLASGAISLDD